MKLIIGNRAYSSWSFRGWLAMRMTGATFREVLFHLGDPASREKIRAVSPGGLRLGPGRMTRNAPAMITSATKTRPERWARVILAPSLFR